MDLILLFDGISTEGQRLLVRYRCSAVAVHEGLSMERRSIVWRRHFCGINLDRICLVVHVMCVNQ
jgi:hypothetical protein